MTQKKIEYYNQRYSRDEVIYDVTDNDIKNFCHNQKIMSESYQCMWFFIYYKLLQLSLQLKNKDIFYFLSSMQEKRYNLTTQIYYLETFERNNTIPEPVINNIIGYYLKHINTKNYFLHYYSNGQFFTSTEKYEKLQLILFKKAFYYVQNIFVKIGGMKPIVRPQPIAVAAVAAQPIAAAAVAQPIAAVAPQPIAAVPQTEANTADINFGGKRRKKSCKKNIKKKLCKKTKKVNKRRRHHKVKN